MSVHHFALPDYQIFASTGLIQIKGQYHLFLLKKSLKHIDAIIEWAHLESNDLLRWKELNNITLDTKNGIFHSGYVVYDNKNTSGLGNSSRNPLIAIFNYKETGSSFYLMFSKDQGSTWEQYGKSPVLETKKTASGDPFIFWYEVSSKWIMLITIPNEYKVQIYASRNLIKWDLISDFGGHPSFNKKWTHATMAICQSVHNKEVFKWVLMIGIAEGEICNRYFVGEFDGKSFKCDHALDTLLRIDYGKDFYAPTLFGLHSDKGVILTGQCCNPEYQEFLPTYGWKGMLTLPHMLHVAKEADGSYRLVHSWIGSWPQERNTGFEFSKSAMTNEIEWAVPITDEMEFDLLIDSHKGCTLEFDFGSKTKLLITWDVLHHTLTLDRTSKNLGFHPSYYSLDQAIVSHGHILSIRIVLGKYSIEILADGGRVSMTSLFFGPNPLQRFRILGKQFAAGGKIWNLNKS
jgi:sucrose-6-phosphate hydrolase SacC (GH32 family)